MSQAREDFASLAHKEGKVVMEGTTSEWELGS